MANSKAELVHSASFGNVQDKSSVREAIIKTLIYSDIFDFPLTKDELWIFLISNRRISRESFDLALDKLTTYVIASDEGEKQSRREKKSNRLPRPLDGLAMTVDNYFCLKGHEKIINNRKNNLEIVKHKHRIAKRAAEYLKIIPTLLFIGISGGLAMDDVEKKDDIDLFIISKKNYLYTTRFLIWIILAILGLRRKKNDNDPTDKICVNLLMDETSLSFSTNKRDLYTAHEIVQIKPLFQRKNIYYKFLKSNNWVNNIFPNMEIERQNNHLQSAVQKNSFFGFLELMVSFLPIEYVLKKLQVMYMNRSKNSKSMPKSVLAFHPNDYRVQVLKKMNLRMQELGLLTKI